MNTENEDPKEPAKSENTADAKDAEVVRRLVVPNGIDVPTKADDPRSPGVQDRDASVPNPQPNSSAEESEVVRRLVVPDTADDENSEDG
jgi:hypothetical protein